MDLYDEIAFLKMVNRAESLLGGRTSCSATPSPGHVRLQVKLIKPIRGARAMPTRTSAFPALRRHSNSGAKSFSLIGNSVMLDASPRLTR
jgi:hypothetical protein